VGQSSRTLTSGTVPGSCSEPEKNNEKPQWKECSASGSKFGPHAYKSQYRSELVSVSDKKLDRIKTGKEKSSRNDRRHNEYAKSLPLNIGI